MENNVRVSVIIPFNKGDSYLKDCLNSLSEQEYKDYEVILVQDHYEGNITELTAPYTDKMNLRILNLPDNKTGVAAARNAGLDAAQGEFVYFLDADDFIFEDAIRTMVETSDETDEDMVYGKKHYTYYSRKVFLPIYIEKREALLAQQYTDSGGNNAGAASEEDDDEEGESEDVDTVSAKEAGDEDADPEDSGSEKYSDIRDVIRSTSDTDYRNSSAYRKYMYRIFPETDEFATNEEKDEWLAGHYLRARNRGVKRLIYKKKRFRNISVLHILIRRSIIEDKHLRFDESLKYYSDAPFLTVLLNDEKLHIKKRFASHYIKRRHQDIVSHPALTQIQDEGRFDEMIRTMKMLLDIAEPGPVKTAVEHQIAVYCAGYFLRKAKRSEADKWRNERFAVMTDITQYISKETLKKEPLWRRNAVKAVRAGNLRKSLNNVTIRLALRMIQRVFKGKHVISKHMYTRYLKKPISENTIMFESFFGKAYSDSPKYIYEYIAKNYPGKYNLVWVLNKRCKLPYGGKTVKRFSLRYMYYLATSKYFVWNVRQPEWFKKREGTVFFETWHGTPLKRLAFDLEDVFGATPNYKKQIYKQSRSWDYLLSPNVFSTGCFSSCFRYDKKQIVEYGYPRNDILHSEEGKELAPKIKKKLGIDPDKKLILYAPTWRDDECIGKGKYTFELKLDLDLMQRELGDGYVVLLRTHYHIANAVDTKKYKGFVVNVCNYNDIAELYLISDILVTDYSSVFFDFAGLKRPMLFYTYDLEKYRDILHGFYMNMEEEVPGPMLFTTAEVVEAIKNIDRITAEYKDKYEVFYQKYGSLEDGHAAERCVNKILGL